MSSLVRQYKEALKICKLYSKFDVIFLKRGKGRIIKFKGITAEQFIYDVYKKLYCEHIHKKEEVLIQPHYFDCVLIDDPKLLDFSKYLTIESVVVRTSEGKYQIHIPLPEAFRSYDPERRRLLMRCFSELFKSDRISWNHARKLPGFFNHKYNPPVYIEIVNFSSKINIYALLMEHIDPIWQRCLSELERLERNPDTTPPEGPEGIVNTKIYRDWWSFYDGDESRADYRYAIYLFSRGLTYSEVKERILRESKDIHVRKRGHLADYLRRTLSKAQAYAQATYEPPHYKYKYKYKRRAK